MELFELFFLLLFELSGLVALHCRDFVRFAKLFNGDGPGIHVVASRFDFIVLILDALIELLDQGFIFLLPRFVELWDDFFALFGEDMDGFVALLKFLFVLLDLSVKLLLFLFKLIPKNVLLSKLFLKLGDYLLKFRDSFLKRRQPIPGLLMRSFFLGDFEPSVCYFLGEHCGLWIKVGETSCDGRGICFQGSDLFVGIIFPDLNLAVPICGEEALRVVGEFHFGDLG